LRAAWASLAAVALLAAVAIERARPPRDPSIDPARLDANSELPAAEFSASRAIEDLRVIAKGPHPAGSPPQDQVVLHLVTRLRALGLDAEIHPMTVRATRYAGTLRNVVARRAGTGSTGTVLLAAHHDSVVRGPGAADDGAAVASILECLRALNAGPPPRNDLLVLITDGEEMGLLGAHAFAEDPARLKGVRVMLNFEARGNAGPTLMFETSPAASRLIDAYAQAVPRPAANSLMAAVYRRMPNDTDFSVFLRKGVPGLNFAFIEGNHAYHTAADSVANLSLDSLAHQGETMLAMLRRLGADDLSGLGGEDLVYFDLLGTWLPRWSARLAWIGTALATLLFALVLRRGARAGRVRVGATLAGAGVVLASALVAAAAAWGSCRLVLAALAHEITGPAKGTPQDAWIHAGLAFLTLGVFLLAARGCRRLGRENLAAGGLLLQLVLLLTTQFVLVEGTFLFLVPVVGGSLALALSLRPGGALRALLVGLAAGLGALVVAPMVPRLYVAMTLERPYVATALLGLFLGTLVPCLPGRAKPAA
jgi:hypothetical protein